MGSLYRSRHELVFVFKNGTAPHINNVELGKNGRNRTNVWEYPGVNSFGPERQSELAMHPTVKPMALVADALLDCSHRGGLVLDPFAGSGTILMAAQKTGRRANGVELDPHYVDGIIHRLKAAYDLDAELVGEGLSFAQVRAARSGPQSLSDTVEEPSDTADEGMLYDQA
jgi:DNA modification methylase